MSVVPREILHWIDQKYPKPRVDREWLQGCYEWAVEEPGVGPVPPYPPKLFELIEDQLLKSNLSESMDLETGLPVDIGDFNKTITLSGSPTLVEITSLTEIGYSAFQLDQIRKAREERIQAGLDEYGEGEEDADIEIEGEGPLPKYPRGMLSFVLSDGKTSFKACEYRTLPDLSLVRTPLGFKLHLKNVRIVRGVAHLEPSNVTLLGGYSDLQTLTNHHFRQNLRQRMNLPPEATPEEAEEHAAGAPPQPPHAAGGGSNGRAPLQEISPPPSPPLLSSRNDDEDLEPRRRRVPSTSSTLLPSVSRSQLSSTSPYFNNAASASNPNMTSSMPLSPTLRQTAPTRTVNTASPPMSDLDVDWAILDEMEQEASNRNRSNSNNKGKKKDRMTGTVAKAEVTLLGNLQEPTAFPRIFAAPPSLDSKLQLAPGFDAQSIVNQSSNNSKRTVVVTTSRPPPPPEEDDDDMYDGMMDDDVLLGSDDLRMLENAEQEAMATATASAPTPRQQARSATSRTATTRTTTAATPKPSPKPFPVSQPTRADSSKPRVPPSASSSRQLPTEIITIDSDSDSDMNNGMPIDDDDIDDKENMPVETRHVRRRIAGRAGANSNVRGGELAMLSQSQSRSRSRQPQASQRRPSSEEVLEISDSD